MPGLSSSIRRASAYKASNPSLTTVGGLFCAMAINHATLILWKFLAERVNWFCAIFNELNWTKGKHSPNKFCSMTHMCLEVGHMTSYYSTTQLYNIKSSNLRWQLSFRPLHRKNVNYNVLLQAKIRIDLHCGWGPHHRGVRMRGEKVGRKKCIVWCWMNDMVHTDTLILIILKWLFFTYIFENIDQEVWIPLFLLVWDLF